MPHWINVTGRSKGTKFRCSKCQKECVCIFYGANKQTNTCNYEFCPRCGSKMDLGNPTRIVQVEEPIKE